MHLCPCRKCACKLKKVSLDFTSELDNGRVTQLLQSNSAPLTSERSTLLATIQEAEVMEDAITKQLKALAQLSNSLKGRLAVVSTEKKKWKQIGHPIRTIPVDVLCEIFIHCVDQQPSTKKSSKYSNPEAPWNLLCVCRYWRDVVLTSPRLWSFISVAPVNLNRKKVAHALKHGNPRVHLLRAHLQRSAGHPLSISLRTDWGYTVDKDWHAIAGLLTSCSSRWQSLYVDILVGGNLAWIEQADGFLGSLQRLHLESVRFDADDDIGAEHQVSVSGCLMRAPALRKVYAPSAISKYFEIPFAQLDQFGVTELVDIDGLGELLASMAGLRNGIFQIKARVDSDAVATPFDLASMTDLTLCFQSEVAVEQFLCHVTIPRLQKLRLVDMGDHPLATKCSAVMTFRDLTSFIQRSQLQLSSLSFTCKEFTEETLMELLQVLNSTLEELSISSNTKYGQRFIHLLVTRANPEANIFLPRLHILRLRGPLDESQHTVAELTVTRPNLMLDVSKQALPPLTQPGHSTWDPWS